MSTNISKLHREELLDKIRQIRTYIATAPQDANTGNLLQYLDELTKDVKGKKYGLVFEQHHEKIDEKLETHVPVLTEDKNLFVDNGGEINFLIEGDNLAALKLLEKTHKGQIDVIYIDPPYNTGKDERHDFFYDDKFVGENETFRHSMWCSFMEKRLRIAKELLRREGVIFISIDDNEQANLKLLCDSIFDDFNFVATYFWKRTSTPPALSRKVRKKLEYVLCYQKTNIPKRSFVQSYVNGGDVPLLNSGNPESILTFPKGCVKFGIKDGTYSHQSKHKIKLLDDVIVIDGKNSNEFRAMGHFKWSQRNLLEEVEDGTYFLIKTNLFSPRFQKSSKSTKVPSNIIDEEVNVGTNESAQKELKLVNIPFNYAKPTSLIQYLLKMAFWDHHSITILDFFAGSGTTGHAVMKLNAENKEHHHKFILCTNNENNICRDITYPRLKTVITGKCKDGSDYSEKYDASLKYYKIDYIPISDKLYYEYADDLLKHVRELVELENGINFNGNSEISIVLNDDEMEKFISLPNNNTKILYRGHNVLLTAEQEDFLKTHHIKVNVIPNYYYNELNK